MKHLILRRLTTLGAALALGVASSPRLEANSHAPVRAATVASSQSTQSTAGTETGQRQSGQGWGSMIACAGCLVGAGVVVAGGPAAIIVAVNVPGSAVAAMACVAVCYEAFQ